MSIGASPAPTARAPRVRWRRALFGVLAVVLAFEALLNVALNVGLVSGLLRATTPHTRLDWSQGWWLWPGPVHLRDFSLKERDNRQAWRVDAARVKAHVSLFRLLTRKVLAHDVEAHGLVFWLTSEPALEARPTGPPAPHPWVIELDRVTVRDVREVNWETLRYTGPCEVDGWLHVVAGQRFTAGLERLHLAGGNVESKGERVATLEQVDGTLVLDNIQPPLEAEHRVDGHIDVRVDLFDLGWLWPMLGSSSSHAGMPRGGAGQLEARLRFHRGHLAAGSRVEARGAELEVALGPAKFHAPWSLHGTVTQEQDQLTRGELTVRFAPVRVEGHVGTVARIPEVSLTLHARSHGPDASTIDLEQQVRIGRSHPIDLRLFNAWTGKTFQVDSGTATLSGRDTPGPVREPHRLNLLLKTDLVEGRWAGNARMLGQADFDIDARRVSLQGKAMSLEGTHVELSHVSMDLKRMQIRAWSGQFSLPAATLNLEPVALETRFSSTFANSDPFVALLTAEKALPTFLSPLFKAKDLKVTGWLRISDAGLQVRDLHATAEGGLELRGWVDTRRGVTNALVLATAGGITGAIEIHPGHHHLQLHHARRWFEKRLRAPAK
ncbi:hypothetical protein LZ198_20155 [Myxococcus sp. K15C18031901]|uniref:hypothetical protein n=1 Tax=Myxococcus dinghuensis TaxID=2906761 RepID=UPI0020A770AD|nr:hypothetical protein [Myxococcus dinghuensis]MCP3101194.1 hypothetical protein [Myxococcus dinghuensis]